MRSFDYLNDEAILEFLKQDAGAISNDASEYLDSVQRCHAGSFTRADGNESAGNLAVYNSSEGGFDSDEGEEDPGDEDNEADDGAELEPDLESMFLNHTVFHLRLEILQNSPKMRPLVS